MMSKNLAIGLMVACLSIASPIESTLYKSQNAIAIASDVRIPNFTPQISLRGNTADLIFPKDLIEAILRQTLAINEQRLKDTEFNRITIKGTNCEIAGDKIRISGIIQGEHRELIAKNPFTGKKHYTPWVSASGRVTQLFSLQIVGNKTIVRNIGDPKLEGLEARWYADAVSLAGRFIGPLIAPKITKGLSNFNGLDIRRYAIDKGSPLLASKLGVPEPKVRSVLSSNIGPINARINGKSQFVISFTFPQF